MTWIHWGSDGTRVGTTGSCGFPLPQLAELWGFVKTTTTTTTPAATATRTTTTTRKRRRNTRITTDRFKVQSFPRFALTLQLQAGSRAFLWLKLGCLNVWSELRSASIRPSSTSINNVLLLLLSGLCCARLQLKHTWQGFNWE